MALGITDAELSLVLNFVQALMLAWITGRQAHASAVIKETNAVVKNGHGRE
jgi:hypothetical protein